MHVSKDCSTLLHKVNTDPEIRSIIEGIEAGYRDQLIAGLTGSAKSLLYATLVNRTKRPIVIVTHHLYAAQKMVDDLRQLLPPEGVTLYPANELIAAEAAISNPETVAQRLNVVQQLVHRSTVQISIIVVPIAGLRRLLPDPAMFAAAQIRVAVGDQTPIPEFATKLVELGYSRVDKCEVRGEFSVRGGLLDIYPMTSEHPLRLEWFGDELESIRTFDIVTQRTLTNAVNEGGGEGIALGPCRELLASKQQRQQAAQHARHLLDAQLAKMPDRAARERLQQHVQVELEQLEQGIYFDEMYKYMSLLHAERYTLLDYLPSDSLLVFDEPARLAETSKQLEQDEQEWKTHLLGVGKLLPQFTFSKSVDDLMQHRKFQALFVSLFLKQVPHVTPHNVVNVVSRTMQHFHGQMNVLKSEVERWNRSHADIIVTVASEESAQKLERVFEDFHIPSDAITVIRAELSEGFEMPSVQLVVLTDNEMFAQRRKSSSNRRAPRTEQANAERIRSYTELKVGDYVVHQTHGIGKYIGIGTVEVMGVHRDYMHVMYASGDKLSIPIEQIDLIQKYVGAEDKEPRMSKLGGAEWQRLKSRAQASVKDIADDLIKLYAARQASQGFKFGPDTSEQALFEQAFPYVETVDQLRAIKEIKADMMKPRPMDRLLCGDVGYGKTEVAMRAAFKAAMDGKQVAILVPTTILAQQHYESFKQRCKDFALNVQVLSRFRSKKEQLKTIEGIARGTVDIVIGTHRLLSEDLTFKQLGLIVVDEEQRFGVTHKEKLKKLRTNVDVLTLTATPIPRTLHMSMIGVRDLSIIETPPENRFPVQTYVLEHSQALVKEAIERELQRGGQVYYLYNRVQGIEQIAEHIRSLVPDARISIGHGRMTEQQLERTILDFLEGESDVLVSTSIIETGVDIPNVNTLIVHDADKMGLSQLYQIRGRVGRSNRIAYAYFTYQRDKVLNEVAEKRLQSIKEFTELGSGFKIAMRDLAIRGAGNLLGAEQHGFIASVGFEMYSRMLAEEIEARKLGMPDEQRTVKPRIVTHIDVQIDAYLPGSYIYDNVQKVEIYKKLAACIDRQEIDEIAEELQDRFGAYPLPVEQLLTVSRLKMAASACGIESVRASGDQLQLTCHKSSVLFADERKLNAFILSSNNRLATVPRSLHTDKPQLIVRGKGLAVHEQLLLLSDKLDEFLHA